MVYLPMIYIRNIYCTTREETQRAVEGPDCIIVAVNHELAATIAPSCNTAYCSIGAVEGGRWQDA